MSVDPMLSLLTADGPEPEHAEALMLYGRLVGRWQIRNRYCDGQDWREADGQWCFGWVLGGRAVQDVLDCPGTGRYPGTTLRCYLPDTGVWRILWSSPYSGAFVSQVGRPDGDGIIQEGTDPDGTPARWTFSEITADSFHWRGWSADKGGNFELVQEMRARRG